MSFITNLVFRQAQAGKENTNRSKLSSLPNLFSCNEQHINRLLGNIYQNINKGQKILSDPSIISSRKRSASLTGTPLQNIQICKQDINKFLGDIYEKYPEWSTRKQQLLETSKELTFDIENLQKQIQSVTEEDLGNNIKIYAVDGLSYELGQSISALKTITVLMVIHDLLIKVKDLQEEKSYIKAAFELLKVEQCINGIPKEEINDVIVTLKRKVLFDKTELKGHIARLFHRHVQFGQLKPKVIQANVLKLSKQTQELEEIISALVLFDYKLPLKEFCKTFWKNMCKWIIFNTAAIKASDGVTCDVLTVTKKLPTKCNYRDILPRLIRVFNFLHSHFNYKVAGFKTLKFVGRELKASINENLITECLKEVLPKHDDMMAVHKELIEHAKKFQNDMVALEIFDPDSNPILDFTNDIEISLVSKKCHQYLANAILIMKKDLHHYIRIGTPYDSKTPLTVDEFPECSVSQSAVELIELTETLIKQAIKESEIAAQSLICTLQSIFYQYGSIVCGHHDRVLQIAPKHVALFRNNCMYIADQLIKFNNKYATKFLEESLPHPLLFTDQAHQLRTMGGEVFLTFVEEHVRQMEITIDEFQYNAQQIQYHINNDTVYCLKQCMRQYEILRKVWLKILPPTVYSKTIGYLLNAFCKKLIEVVLSAHNIPTKSAERISEIYKHILSKGPKLFQSLQDVRLFVDQWQKLKGLVFILGASLDDINDYWADGKGPLTLYFTVDEMKKLMRALFKKNVPNIVNSQFC